MLLLGWTPGLKQIRRGILVFVVQLLPWAWQWKRRSAFNFGTERLTDAGKVGGAHLIQVLPQTARIRVSHQAVRVSHKAAMGQPQASHPAARVSHQAAMPSLGVKTS